jgi:hypothetical protein
VEFASRSLEYICLPDVEQIRRGTFGASSDSQEFFGTRFLGDTMNPHGALRTAVKGWLFGCGAGLCLATACNSDGFNFEAILVHVKALLAIQGFHEFTRGFGYRSGKAGGVNLDRGTLRAVVAVLIAE